MLMQMPKTLWTKIIETTKTALECGALKPIPTNYEFIEQNGINFLVRIIANLDRKKRDKQQQKQKSKEIGGKFNPFLPYDENLFVSNLSDTHLCLLNKFNVVDHHLLIVTRAFEEQDNWLNLADFEAMEIVLSEIDGLAFYNGGTLAGSSQPHKHLQVVPLPLVEGEQKIPIAPVINNAIFDGAIGQIPAFPFQHALAKLNPDRSAKAILETYQKLLRSLDVSIDQIETTKQTIAYNLLATREWMLIVPRTKESDRRVNINSLGFAGAMLVRDRQQLEIVKNFTPIELLKNVARSSK
jgi:sulfate adenylyltransferase (ADP) / ATP adenylyltransferase